MKVKARTYQLAIDAQSACNLSGIVKGLARDLDEIWEEARAEGKGSDYVAQHPIVRLYIEQIIYLAKCGPLMHDEHNPYSVAYSLCRERAEVAELDKEVAALGHGQQQTWAHEKPAA